MAMLLPLVLSLTLQTERYSEESKKRGQWRQTGELEGKLKGGDDIAEGHAKNMLLFKVMESLVRERVLLSPSAELVKEGKWFELCYVFTTVDRLIHKPIMDQAKPATAVT